MATESWPPEDSKKLRHLWDDIGLSGGQISAQFGGKYSRRSVIGKARRMGLTSRSSTMNRHLGGRGASTAKPAPKPKIAVPAEPITPEPALILDNGQHVTLIDITDKMCRWPIGDPRDEDFHCCGLEPKKGSPYCLAHWSKAHEPSKKPPNSQDMSRIELSSRVFR
jgi:GcrA cell cycle regulator